MEKFSAPPWCQRVQRKSQLLLSQQTLLSRQVGGHPAGTHSFWSQKAAASKEEEEQRGGGFKEDLEKFQLLQGQYHAEEKRWVVQ